MRAGTLRRFPASKIAPPRAATALPRPRLLAVLDAAPALTLLVAPAGSGKSTLLASWAAGGRVGKRAASTCIWYNLDPSDRDAALLVDGIAAACERALPGSGRAARGLLAGGGDPFAGLSMLYAALEASDGPISLVLDNCHHLDGVGNAEAILEYLVRDRPERLRLIVSSRGIPLLPAIALAASGDLLAFGRGDLDFTPAEARSLLQARGLSPEASAAVIGPARGWALGLGLLAQARGDALPFLGQPQEAIGDYLITQVVQRLPDDLRGFLLESALLGEFSARDADWILERDDSARQIDAVLRQGLFADSYQDQEGRAIRYHDLFAEARGAWIRRTDPRRFAQIHRRAADRYEDDPALALAHSAALDEPEALVERLLRALPRLDQRGMWGTLIHYGELLPDEIRPLLLLRVLSYAHYAAGDDTQAIASARQVRARAEAAGDRVSRHSALVLLANPLVRQERFEEALALCLPALEEAGRQQESQVEGWLASLCGDALLRGGQVQRGTEVLQRALQLYRTDTGNGDLSALGHLYNNYAWVLIELGQTAQGAAYLEQAARLAVERADGWLESHCQATRAELLLSRGEDAAAATLADMTSGLARERGHLDAARLALLAAARARGRMGQIEQALVALDLHRTLIAPHQRMSLGRNLTIRARLCLAAGDQTSARAALDQAIALPLGPRTLGLVWLEQGVLMLAEGQFRRADHLFGQAVAGLEAHALHPSLARALVLRAAALLRLERHVPAKACLLRAGTLALGTEWIEGLPGETALAFAALHALSENWRLQGQARELVQVLLERQPAPLRLVPSLAEAAPAPRSARRRATRTALPPGEGVTEIWRYSPFGAGDLRRNDQTPPFRLPHGGKARELLAFAIWQARPLARDEILDALWDGDADDRALGAFRTATYQIRRVLGDEAWRRTAHRYHLGSPIDDEYRRLLALAAGLEETLPDPEVIALARQATALFETDFLPWCSSLWAEAPRLLARAAGFAAFEALIGAYRRMDQPVAALAVVEQGLSLDPMHPQLREGQIALLHGLGRTSDALESYRTFVDLLDDEGQSPSSALRTLIASVRRG